MPKRGFFSSISLGHFIKHKLFIPEEWPFEIQTFLSSFNFFFMASPFLHLYFRVILLLFRTFLLFFDAADKVLPDVINRKKAINNNSRRGLLCSFAKPHVLTYFSPLLFLKQTPSNWIIISVTFPIDFFL